MHKISIEVERGDMAHMGFILANIDQHGAKNVASIVLNAMGGTKFTKDDPNGTAVPAGEALDKLKDEETTTPPAPPATETQATPPTPPPVVTPPVVDKTPLAPPVGGVELDSRGMPWDARIHAKTKTKKKTGEWKNFKGKSQEEIAAVEAELMAAQGGETAAATTPATPPTPPTSPATTEAVKANIAANDTPLLKFTSKVIRLKNAGVITEEWLNQVAVQFGLTNYNEVLGRPDVIEAFAASLPAE